MSRAEALAALASEIVRHQPDLRMVVHLLAVAGGHARLIRAIGHEQGNRPEVGGRPRPDPEVWRSGRLR